MKKKLSILLLALASISAYAGITVGQGLDMSHATIVYDDAEKPVVATAARLLCNDIERVCGLRPAIAHKLPKKGNAIVIGTLGRQEAEELMFPRQKKAPIDTFGNCIRGQWERYAIRTTDDRIVIAGSDARGTAYGCLALSEAIGVSPWYWWADIPVRRGTATVAADTISPGPKVKYRGIFINDEDWGLKTWAARNYEKELGDIGPKTYAQVCELLLRLRCNMLAPAMHACTGPFYSHPENKVVANQYGILITTSHCEPLLFNNATKVEWDTDVDGPWDFNINREGILRKLDARVKEASPYDNIYTLAMRGLHDAAMQGNLSPDEKVRVLQDAITEQRKILARYGQQDAQQIFIPYKEAMDSYERGLQVPDDVTLVWVDDNYGYMKRLPNEAEQKRSGRGGVYYHMSYLGTPHDYLWINTTPPALMYEELRKAYDAGADRYWLLNVGDIKPMELGLQTFSEMAWDPERFSLFANEQGTMCINRHQSTWLQKVFGANAALSPKARDSFAADCQRLLDEYYRLAWSRKPEYMGWEIEWDAKEYANIRDTEFSFKNYNDAQQRLADYERISTEANRLMMSLPEELRPAFFEMVAFPVMGACQMNRKFLLAQLNHELMGEQRYAEANWAAQQAQAAFDSVAALNLRYNTQLNGKWNEMMHLAPAFRSKNHLMPQVTMAQGYGQRAVDLTPKPYKLEGCAVLNLQQAKGGKLIEGLGYDGHVLLVDSEISCTLPAIGHAAATGVNADSVTVTIYSIPFFPINKEANTRFSFCIDGGKAATAEYRPKEWSYEWKINVLRNAHVTTARLPIDRSKATHTLSLAPIDNGQMVQRIVVDWGGLQPTYVGPSVMHNAQCIMHNAQ